MINRWAAKGLSGKALSLIRDYLYCQFIQVVAAGISSNKKQIFSGVPQGGKWSLFLWDFDICEMCDCLSDFALPFGYADDDSLWFELLPGMSAVQLVFNINQDLARLKAWGDDNNTTFEKTKMELVVISQKHTPLSPAGIVFDGYELPAKSAIKIVGFTVDSKLRWGLMIDRLAKKARSRIEALARIRAYLDSNSMRLMYSSFIRPIMEYGCVAWMGAAPSHLSKLDMVQQSAQRLGNFEIESLESRRNAAALSFSLKMMAGKCKDILNSFTPQLYEPTKLATRISRHT